MKLKSSCRLVRHDLFGFLNLIAVSYRTYTSNKLLRGAKLHDRTLGFPSDSLEFLAQSAGEFTMATSRNSPMDIEILPVSLKRFSSGNLEFCAVI
jgi:hypothetical protein